MPLGMIDDFRRITVWDAIRKQRPGGGGQRTKGKGQRAKDKGSDRIVTIEGSGRFALCPLPFALCPLPFALCPLPFALCPLPFALCPLSFAFSGFRTGIFAYSLRGEERSV